jgi:pimeloyl-ACP methyl ester carboxylesterase
VSALASGENVTIRRGYASVPVSPGKHLTVHYRVAGAGPAIVLLHDSPRSSRLHVPLMKLLASRFQVFALDTPGYGNSDPLPLANPTIPDFAKALGLTLGAMGLAQAPIYATHTSAKIALALAVRGGRMARLVLDGLSIPEQMAGDAFIAAYMRPCTPEPSGAWLAAEWTRTRDMLRWFPWFTADAAHRIPMEPPSPAWLEDYGIDLFSAGPDYASAYTAAMRWNPLDDLRAVRVPTIVGARRDDVLFPHLDRVPEADNAHLSIERLGEDRTAWAEWISRSLADDDAVRRASGQSAEGGATRGYLTHGSAQLHWTRYPSHCGANDRPLVILSAPTTLEAHQWARRFEGTRPVFVPDLPGFGDSDPPRTGDADGIADALLALAALWNDTPFDVLAIGFAAPLGARMAARRPDLVGALAIWGVPAPATSAGGLTPEILFDPIAGSHLHRFWHMLRDSTVQWPWHDARPSAARAGPIPDPDDLHLALTGLLKQRTNYGQAIAAALAANQPDDWRRVKVPVVVATGDDPAMASSAALIALLPRATALLAPRDHEAAAAALNRALALASGRTQAEAKT